MPQAHPDRNPQNPAPEAIAYLHERGGHIVLCRGKVPLWRGWQSRRPGVDVVIRHGPEIGILPASLGTSALDVDFGQVGELIEETGPLVTLASPRGSHCYFEDHVGRGNSDWSAYGCRGQVRSARGFLRLWWGGTERLADALRFTPPGTTQFPADLFDAAGVDAPRSIPVEGPRIFLVPWPADLLPIEDAAPGNRNSTLFDHLRFWAYAQGKGGDLDAWADRCQRIALELNGRISMPLPEAEAGKIAWSVAAWTWSGGGPIDHSPMAQRRRGVKSGQVRRAAVAERDAAIVAAHRDGQSMRAIGREYGLSHVMVRKIIDREVVTEPNQCSFPWPDERGPIRASAYPDFATNEAVRPWEAEGVSRRWWYELRRRAKAEGVH